VVEKIKVGGIMQSDGRAVVKVMSCPDRPDIAGLLLGALGDKNINIEFLVQTFDLDGFSNYTLCIDRKDLESSIGCLEAIKPSLEAKVISYNPNVAVISVFGPHFREKPKISGISGDQFHCHQYFYFQRILRRGCGGCEGGRGRPE
jgi:aspartokinase